ncbi:MAG: MBL fold metallo-hydrolase [Gemmatimonadetes bacterium]|nr:MBL fold metallo-hydrolase [Gemmatimonadota bacterium]
MNITFLGTAAAPSMPIPFCVCEVCSKARRVGGKNLRRRSSLVINDDLLVDIGPDMATASFEHGLSLARIAICLQTHPHADHLDLEFIFSRHADYGTEVSGDLLLAGSDGTLQAIDALVRQQSAYGTVFESATQSALKLKLLSLTPFQASAAGDYRIIGYPANHGNDQGFLLYSIVRGNHAVFYGTDTSVLSEEVWEHLQLNRIRYDVVILDHTYGIGFESRPADHLASKDVAAHANRFRECGLLKDTGVVYATHLSHEGNLEHDELDEYAMEHGYRVAYDGLRLRLRLDN